MPELCVGERCWTLPAGSNLLDALNATGHAVPYSCRAGSCHACLVRCLQGQPDDAMPHAVEPGQRAQGWRLACQCSISEDLQVAVFDPSRDGLPAQVTAVDWLGGEVLRLRIQPPRPLRYRAGQHLLLWHGEVARPYSLASLPGEDTWLEFHLDCRRPGAFCDAARRLRMGDRLCLGQLCGGALHYDPDWYERPLWLLATGTGLAPLWGILREAMRQGHRGEIRVLHMARDTQGHYLAEPLRKLAQTWPGLSVELLVAEQVQQALMGLQLKSRHTIALVCGAATSVEQIARRLFMAGSPRGQVFADMFTGGVGSTS